MLKLYFYLGFLLNSSGFCWQHCNTAISTGEHFHCFGHQGPFGAEPGLDVQGQGGNLCRGCLCRKRCAVGRSMIYMSFLLDESIVSGIDFSNTLQGHTCF